MAGFYRAVSAPTPKRDIDLFGPTTVRIERSDEQDGPGVPLLYLSAYVQDAERLAQRVCGGLAWLDLAEVLPPRSELVSSALARSEPAAMSPATTGPYTMPEFVEDVDWSEQLFLPDEIMTTDWKGWAAAFERRVDLAQSSSDLATFEATNVLGLRSCPAHHRVNIGRKLQARYIETADQAAA